ncbi:MAG: cellulase family glycosylhydrolase [Bacteroidales bacterium]|nr:cellulase family glycosylhydrolase [Bacteroidales bacterium]
MKYLKIFLALLAALTLTLACGEEPEPEPIKLSASPAELNFAAEGGTIELAINSGIKPTVSCSDSWISLHEVKYEFNQLLVVKVTATANTGTTVRSSSIRVIGDKQSLMIPVSQDIARVKLTVNPTTVAFDRYGGEMTVTVTSSEQPTVSTSTAWCGVQAGSIGSNRETTVTIAAAANATTSSRSGSVTISCGKESVTVNLTEEAYSVSTASTTALTPEQVFNAMGPGWNMGNHMDAINNGVAGETIWGNAKCTQATFDNVKKAGFKAVRICTTWTGHIGEAPAYRLEDKWLERVAEIVGYAEKAGLVAIVNTHHDETYWLDISKAYNNNTQNEKVKDEIFCVWTQIARRFADKGEWLVFESFNEIQDGGWGWSAAFQANPDVQYKVLNDWNQVFVNAVRGAGGNNATRWLGIPGYAASPGFTITGLVLPKDYTNANRLMVAVHDYDPYNYTLNTPLVRQWGHTADKDKRCSDADEEGVVAVFDNLKKAYLDKNIPVYLGEMGCSRHADEDFAYQQYYMEYFCKAAADRLLPMYLWDNGATGVGPEKHGYFDHGTGAFVDAKAENLIGIMVKAVTTKDPNYTLESVYDSAP